MSIDEMMEVLQAAKAGKRIQRLVVGEWKDFDFTWEFRHSDLRVKPEPREWVLEFKIKSQPYGTEVVKVREVL